MQCNWVCRARARMHRALCAAQARPLQHLPHPPVQVCRWGQGCQDSEDISCPHRRERSKVPYIVRQCVEEIERRGMEEVGIYRVSGVATDIQALKAAFDVSKCHSGNRDTAGVHTKTLRVSSLTFACHIILHVFIFCFII